MSLNCVPQAFFQSRQICDAFIISFIVTKPGEGKGARFVQAFKQVMGKNKPDQDFINVLTEANDLIASQVLAQGNDKLELPCIISTLTKKIIFPKK